MADEIGEGWSLGLDEGAQIESEDDFIGPIGMGGIGEGGLGVAST
jgi:hypothetical protein